MCPDPESRWSYPRRGSCSGHSGWAAGCRDGSGFAAPHRGSSPGLPERRTPRGRRDPWSKPACPAPARPGPRDYISFLRRTARPARRQCSAHHPDGRSQGNGRHPAPPSESGWPVPAIPFSCSVPLRPPHSFIISAPWRSALTTGSSSPLRNRIRAPPPVQI